MNSPLRVGSSVWLSGTGIAELPRGHLHGRGDHTSPFTALQNLGGRKVLQSLCATTSLRKHKSCVPEGHAVHRLFFKLQLKCPIGPHSDANLGGVRQKKSKTEAHDVDASQGRG